MTEVVAEISGNHNGSLANAFQLIGAAKAAGADAVKFQTFMPERLAARRAQSPEVLALAGGVPLLDLYQKTWTPWTWFPHLIEQCKNVDIAWFSSVFDPLDVAFLETMGCPRYKISAFESLDWDIIKAVRETGKPIVMSVRSRPGLTVLLASGYDGVTAPLGLSAHGDIMPSTMCPMAEYHLKLPGMETPDSAFSLTPEQLRRAVDRIRS